MQLTSDQHQKVWDQFEPSLLQQRNPEENNFPTITSPAPNCVWILGTNPPVDLKLFNMSSTLGYVYEFRLNVSDERAPQIGEIRFEVSKGGTVRFVVDEERTFDTLSDLCDWLIASVIQGKRTLE